MRAFIGAIVASVSLVGSAMATDWGSFYGKVYGGLTLPDMLYFNGGTYDIDSGLMGGAAVGVNVVDEVLAIELDATASNAIYPSDEDSLAALTMMGNVVARLPLAETFNVYAGAGGGVVFVDYDGGPSLYPNASGMAPAAQVFAGAEMALTDNIAVFGEARFQTAVGYVPMVDVFDNSYELEFRRSAVLVGFRISQ